MNYDAKTPTADLPSDEPQPAARQPAARKGQRHAGAVSTLRKMILAGELAPGERLREVALCTQLGVSRTPVREAFRTLAAEGLVKLLPNRSVIVAELDTAEISDLFDVFGTIEGLAGELACARLSDAQIAEIAELHHEMVVLHEHGDRANYLDTNHLIHRRIVEASGNQVLISIWELLLPRVQHARAVPNIRPERWVEAVYEHAKILAALSKRDGQLLSRLMREHFRNALSVITPPAGEQPKT